MISSVEHEQVFRWLHQLSKEVSFDIKTTVAQHYRRVVIQQKMRENVDYDQAIYYQDALRKGRTGQFGGLGRAPKGVNDGNGFVFISHTGDVYPSGLLPVKAGNVRAKPLAEIYRDSPFLKIYVILINIKASVVFVSFDMFAVGRSRAYAMTGDYMESEPFCVYVPKSMRKQNKAKIGYEQ